MWSSAVTKTCDSVRDRSRARWYGSGKLVPGSPHTAWNNWIQETLNEQLFISKQATQVAVVPALDMDLHPCSGTNQHSG